VGKLLKIFNMDMFRILHSKMFYICIFSMNLVAGSMIFFGTIPSLSVLMGSGTTDMTSSMMGIGMALMIVGIFFALFICQEFTTGYAKNIFARHANPRRYVGGKLLSLTASGAIMIVVFTIISIILLAAVGNGVELPGGIVGLITFFIEKIFICAAFASLILLACVFTRKSVVGVLTGVLVAIGVIPMVLGIAGNYFGLTWVADILKYTISGLSGTASLIFSGSTFVTIVVGGVIWTAVCAVLGSRAVKLKDI
jgi:ABC-type transport system involved in multi-copper enzyme maturation permease subunit